MRQISRIAVAHQQVGCFWSITFSLVGCGLLLSLISCGVIDLSGPWTYDVSPGSYNQIIATTDNVSIGFPDAVQPATVEKLIAVIGPSSTLSTVTNTVANGTLPVRFQWTGNQVTIFPVNPYPIGIRLLLSASGTFQDSLGRSHQIAIQTPFFVGQNNGPLTEIASTPATGSTISPTQPVTLQFNLPITDIGLRAALSLSPTTNVTVAVDSTGLIATITPVQNWTNATTYTLTVGSTITSTVGIAAIESFAQSFFVNTQTGPLQISNTYADSVTTTPSLSFSHALTNLDGIAATEAIEVDFSAPPAHQSFEDGVTFLPSLSGTWYWTAATAAVFIPTSPLTPQRTYTLSSSGAQDLYGTSFAFYQEQFTVSTPYINLVSLQIGTYTTSTYTNPDPVPDVQVTGGPTDFQTIITLTFDTLFSLTESQTVQNALKISPLFPSTLGAPSVISYVWNGATLTVTCTGLSPSTLPTQSNYYLVDLPAGYSAFHIASGSYMQNEVKRSFRAVP